MRMTTKHVRSNTIEDVIKSLEKDSMNLFKQSRNNQMKPNKDKCNLLISGGKNITINIDGNNIEKKQL